jgi:hypothetical protein
MRGSGSSPSSPQTTSDSAVVLAAAQLQQQLTRQIEKGSFCAAEPLAELAIHARNIRYTSPIAEHRLLAFVLQTVCQELADDQTGRQVRLSETNSRRKLFHKPITEAATCLVGRGGDVFAIANSLVKAISEALPIPS